MSWSGGLDSVKENALLGPSFSLACIPAGGQDCWLSFIPTSRVTTYPGLLGTSLVLAPNVPISGTLEWPVTLYTAGCGIRREEAPFFTRNLGDRAQISLIFAGSQRDRGQKTHGVVF